MNFQKKEKSLGFDDSQRSQCSSGDCVMSCGLQDNHSGKSEAQSSKSSLDKMSVLLSGNYPSSFHNHAIAKDSCVHLGSNHQKNKIDSSNNSPSNKSKDIKVFLTKVKVIPNYNPCVIESRRKRHFTDEDQNCHSGNNVDVSKKVLTESNENCGVNSLTSQKLCEKYGKCTVNLKKCEAFVNNCSFIIQRDCKSPCRTKNDDSENCLNKSGGRECSKNSENSGNVNFINNFNCDGNTSSTLKSDSDSSKINFPHSDSTSQTSMYNIISIGNVSQEQPALLEGSNDKLCAITESSLQNEDELKLGKSAEDSELNDFDHSMLSLKDFDSDSDADSSLPSISFGNEPSHNSLFQARSSTKSPFYSEPSSPHTFASNHVTSEITLDSIILARKISLGNKRKLQELENELQVIIPSVKELGSTAQVLEQLKVEATEIVDDPPGEEIFASHCLNQLFDETVLPLPSVEEASSLPSFLQGNSANLIDILMSGSHAFCYNLPETPSIISWLFKLMSVHSHPFVTYSSSLALTFMIEQAHERSQNLQEWIPSIKDITKIFINYGASLNNLCPFSHLLPFQEDDLGSIRENPAIDEENKMKKKVSNIIYVFQFIKEIISNFYYYNKEEFIFLFIMLCQVGLDVNLIGSTCLVALKDCLNYILKYFVAEEWNEQVVSLSLLLCNMTRHHHNMVYIAKMLPYTERGLQLQKATSFLMIKKLTTGELKTVVEVKPTDVLNFLQFTSLKNLSFYQQHSIIQLLDLCIGNEKQTGYKRELQKLIDLLQKISVDIKENVTNIDSSKVKDIIVRLKSKWTLMSQELKQTTIFNYFPTPTKIETLISCSDDDSENNLEEKESGFHPTSDGCSTSSDSNDVTKDSKLSDFCCISKVIKEEFVHNQSVKEQADDLNISNEIKKGEKI